MEGNIERECSALGGLFQQIIADMKNGTPLWEDLIAKATKLHTCLRATIQAITAYLDAFQKIADAATNTRGATKEIGTALTRICLRHKAVEARMKTFTSAIMDCLVVPLQEKLEDWKKSVINIDKEHAKEYKRAKADLKKKSTDTLRLQKKARKGKSGELQRRVETSLQDVTERKHLLEETEKHAVRAALIEERSRFCLFVAYLKPVVDEEVAMLSELTHLQEVLDQLEKHTADPFTLPPASEQVIADLKSSESSWSFQTPPSSPSSLGSRKSSMCSISSLNSSSSGSTKSHSPSHHYWHRSLSQQPIPAGTLRLSSVSSQDSGFTSQDMLFLRPPSPSPAVHNGQVSNMSEQSSTSNSSNSSTPSTPYPAGGGGLPNTTATWPNLQETLQFERAATAIMNDRPHTISSNAAHPQSSSQPASPIASATANESNQQQASHKGMQQQQTVNEASSQPIYARPPIPQRCSSLERPNVPAKTPSMIAHQKKTVHEVKVEPKTENKTTPAISSFAPPPMYNDSPQPVYVNMHELASMAASKAQEANFPPPPPDLSVPPDKPDKVETTEKDGSTSESSLESSSGYGSQTTIPIDESGHNEVFAFSSFNLDERDKYCTLPRMAEPPLPPWPVTTIPRRPLSTSGYPSGNMRNTLLRRGSNQGQKPLPPIRRTSSISNPNATTMASIRQAQQLAMQAMQQVTSNSGATALTQTSTTAQAPVSQANSDTSSVHSSNTSTPRGSMESLPPPPPFLLDNLQDANVEAPTSKVIDAQKGDHIVKKRSISVADTVRTLTQLNHQPASPNMVRRTHSLRIGETNIMRSQSAERKPSRGEVCEESLATSRASLIQALSAKLGHQPGSPGKHGSATLSPKHTRRHSEEFFRQSPLQHLKSAQKTFQQQPAMTHVTDQNFRQTIHFQTLQHGRRASEQTEESWYSTSPQHQTLLQTLNAKFSQKQVDSEGGRGSKQGSPKLRHGLAPKQSFLDSLNAKLAQQQQSQGGQRTDACNTAMKVRQWIASRTIADPAVCHESLMDQIKRGTSLRKTRAVNDRSAPRIH